MIKNYFKTTLRHLLRNKLFSGLNIFGLATGMASSIVIFLWVKAELSFDKFNDHADHMFRVTAKVADVEVARVPPSLAYAIKTEIPAVENATRVASGEEMISVGTKTFRERKIFYADSNFFQMFSYSLLKGDRSSALSSPENVVLTEKLAEKYFGSANAAMGKTIYIDDDIKGTYLTVTGILKNIPSNSHLQPDMLISMNMYDKVNNPDGAWNNFDVYVYFQLKNTVALTAAGLDHIGKQINGILKRNNPIRASLFIQPLTDIHLRSHYLGDVEGQGSAMYVNIFILVGVFIILIAGINFMNLSTAVSGRRAKEVGLRKTIGARRFQLVGQFIGESLLIAFVSLIIAISIVCLTLPLFNRLTAQTISFNPFSPGLLIQLIGVALITGVLSGSYPAVFLSSFSPVKALKGDKLLNGGKSLLRNGLVVLQFSISIILIISTLIVYKQRQYIQNRNIGFNKENLLYLKQPEVGDLKNNKDAMMAALASYPDIRSYTFTDDLPTNLTSGSLFSWQGMKPGTQVNAYRLRVDENFAGTFGMQIIAGRFFSKDFGGDDSSYVVNETTLKVMGLKPEEAIGKLITFWDKRAPIIGVVKDFNFKPVQQPVAPLIMKSNFAGGYIVMRTTPENIQKVIGTLQKSFRNVYGNYPFAYGFVDEDLSRLYMTEQRMGNLFNIFSVLSVIISCLGLFGLAAFAMQQRTKEIGLRKIMGATVPKLWIMLSRDFIYLIIISCFVAAPLAWYFMHHWLNNYAYRTGISWWVFLAAGGSALAIGLFTVSFQAVKAALSNPIESLRTE